MKKTAIKLLIAVLLVAGAVWFLNMEVTYRQGVNFKVSTIKIPLYLKVLDFFDRHYNYKNLAWKIIKESDTPEERVMKIFNWTYGNIKRVPEGYPIIDDHVWHIIVRGYGTSDQYQDVFTTLCNYAGINSFFEFIYAQDNTKLASLSFVELNKEWRVFDAYRGVYFRNKTGGLSSVGEIKSGEWQAARISKTENTDYGYALFLKNLPSFENLGLKRANIQSPLKRLIFQIKQWSCGKRE